MRQLLLTGCTRGIGRAIARRLDTDGAAVVGVYRRDHGAADSLREACSPRLRAVACDLGDEAACAALVSDLPDELDGVVLNAGVATRAPFDATEVEGRDPLREQIELDLVAPLWLLRSILNAGKLRDGSSIVFVSSNLARRGLAQKVAYSAAKAGLEGACRGLARELGARQFRVNAVAPGLLETDMTSEMGEEGYHGYATEVPLGRVGQPADIAGVVAFLLSEDAAYVSGQVLDVDGGWSA